ncbi:MAG: stage III sporulation protein AE [Clostridia bacterium]|nr:stage III sporulation protein AE [Clostridia bacterium]
MKFKKFTLYKRNKLFYISILFVLVFVLMLSSTIVYAENQDSEAIYKELNHNIENIISGIDFSGLNDIVSELDDFNLFRNGVLDKLKNILSGQYFNDYGSLFSSIFSLLIVDIKEFLPFLFTILAIGILSNLLSEFKSGESSSDIVHYSCLSVMILSVLFVFKDVLLVTSNTLELILKQMQIIFPILITLLASIGSFTTISIYNPLVAVLTTIVSFVFEKLLYPMFIAMFLFTIIGNLTNTIKLDKIQGFVTSSFKWIVGIVFTLFTGFLSIQGISAGKFDSVSIKATKFAVKSYIPIIGSYLSDGMDFLVLGSVLVKNSIGLVGVLILFFSIISPIVSILVLKLGLQLVSGVLEMSGSSKMSSFLSNCSKILIYPIVLILGVAFMYVITISLIMCTANIF